MSWDFDDESKAALMALPAISDEEWERQEAHWAACPECQRLTEEAARDPRLPCGKVLCPAIAPSFLPKGVRTPGDA